MIAKKFNILDIKIFEIKKKFQRGQNIFLLKSNFRENENLKVKEYICDGYAFYGYVPEYQVTIHN